MSTEPQRPDPDALLARVLQQEADSQRGRLKIFFGAAAGVGKTYTMLDAAQRLKTEGVDVVAGYIEPHSRPETAALLEGLEVLPARAIDYKGATLREFDLDAALARKPALLLVDELAHTNAPGSRHPKRWQDVEELLDAGINVYTTVNVQHIESLNDVVAQITGTIVRETIPDSILERADEVELIDIAPEDLLKRLREGKIYMPQQAEQAVKSFFRKGNLMALRELALRRTAERVDEQMQDYRIDKAVADVWPAGEHLLVCISPSPLSIRLVRAAKRMATGLHAKWEVAFVETPRAAQMPDSARARVNQTLHLAEALGGETVMLSGQNIPETVLHYARQNNITKIIVGKPIHSAWRDLVFGSVLNDLVRQSGAIDVYVINGDDETPAPRETPRAAASQLQWGSYIRAVTVIAAVTGIAAILFPLFAPVNLIMLYLVGCVFVAVRFGRGASILASFLSVLAFDFFFVPPYGTFVVSDTQYVLTFLIMLIVALVISDMALRMKLQAEHAREREQRTARLYQMSRDFAVQADADALAAIAVQHIEGAFDCAALVLTPDDPRPLRIHGSPAASAHLTEQEMGVARWAYDHGQVAGVGTSTLPGSRGLYLPLNTPQGRSGLLAVYMQGEHRLLSPDQNELLETFANQMALALERARLAC
ncbi:MAG: sensor histidine kinase KdpD [Chloroflexota bacterium]|nr:sensor histidine kinase KdpD [Chloroflexota bacterium]